MRIGHRTERRLAGEAPVDLPAQVAANRTLVLAGQLHEKVVWMLAIVNRVTIALLTRGQQVGISASTYRRRFHAEHRAESCPPGSDVPASHPHEPVGAA